MAFANLASVLPEDPTGVKVGKSGEALTRGQFIRINSSHLGMIADSETSGEDNIDGVVLHDCPSGSTFTYAPPGSVVSCTGGTAGGAVYLGGASDQGKAGTFDEAISGTHLATLAGMYLSTTRFYIIGKTSGFRLS